MGMSTLVVAVVWLLDLAPAFLLVVHELTCINATVFVEILPFSLLFVLVPVSNIELAFLVVVFAFAVLHAFLEVAFVSFGV